MFLKSYDTLSDNSYQNIIGLNKVKIVSIIIKNNIVDILLNKLL